MSTNAACPRQAQLRSCAARRPFTSQNRRVTPLRLAPFQAQKAVHTRKMIVVATSPQPEIEEAPATGPQEWDTPMPSKRPDIFPEFEKLETTLPKPLPGDPELPDEEMEEEKIKAPPAGDPEPVDPDAPEEPEEPEEEGPGGLPERPRPDLPRIPV